MLEVVNKPATCRQASPLTVETYHEMIRQGIIDPKNELLWGVIVKKMSKSPLHALIAEKFRRLIEGNLENGFFLRSENPLTLEHSEPEPDLAIITGTHDDYRTAHPTTASFVIEVAVTSLNIDREKATLYAEAGVPHYWIFNMVEKKLEVYSDIKDGVYKMQQILSANHAIEVPCTDGYILSLSELLD